MTVYGGIDDYIERGVPVMSAVEIGALERRTSEAHGVIDAYDASYWETMTRSGASILPLLVYLKGTCFRLVVTIYASFRLPVTTCIISAYTMRRASFW